MSVKILLIMMLLQSQKILIKCSALLNVMTSKHRKEGEKIYCIESGRNFGNDHECLIATDSNLYLIDQRHCGEPLLQMGTCMMFPPQYIRPCAINSTEVRESEFSPSRW